MRRTSLRAPTRRNASCHIFFETQLVVENIQRSATGLARHISENEKKFWKAKIGCFLVILYDSFRNNLFATPCRMVKSSHFSEFQSIYFRHWSPEGINFNLLHIFTRHFENKLNISKDEIPSFWLYNKSRNNLFGPLYHWKKLERCVALAYKCSKNNWSLDENIQGLLDSRSTFQWKYEKQFWKAKIVYFLVIYDSFRNNLFCYPL